MLSDQGWARPFNSLKIVFNSDHSEQNYWVTHHFVIESVFGYLRMWISVIHDIAFINGLFYFMPCGVKQIIELFDFHPNSWIWARVESFTIILVNTFYDNSVNVSFLSSRITFYSYFYIFLTSHNILWPIGSLVVEIAKTFLWPAVLPKQSHYS